MENENSIKSSGLYMEDIRMAIYGVVNGVILYTVIWPFISVVLMRLVLQNSYGYLVNNYENTMELVLMILSLAFTFVTALVIAKPKTIFNLYKKIDNSNIGLIFKSLGYMLLFSFLYNLMLILIGLDIGQGNANQSDVVTLVKSNPPLAFIAMIILAPVVEEITYRFFVFAGFSKANRKWAIIASGFIFMMVHSFASFTQEVANMFNEIILLPPYMVSGLILAHEYDKSENLLVPTSTHALNNLISFIVCLF